MATGMPQRATAREELNPFLIAQQQFDRAAHLLKLDPGLRQILRARIVAEAANGPTTPRADEVLQQRGVFLLPDILANAGGVTVSYFEWVQDLQWLFWEQAEVTARLLHIMKKAFHGAGGVQKAPRGHAHRGLPSGHRPRG